MDKKDNTNEKYKSKKCKQFHERQYCPYGSRCLFRHDDLEEERPLPGKYR